jgi:CubicO group peptidase (beta-lactamase class C family)
MRALKVVGKLLLALLALLVIVVNVYYWSDPVFYRRMAMPIYADIVRDVDKYKPLELVKGNPASPLVRAGDVDKTISPEAWQTALDYAKKMDSYALVVWQGGAIQYEYYFPGFKPEDRTDPASMHKSVFALLFGQLIADGLIKSVDEPVATYLTEWANDERQKITFRNLLNMASGLERQPFSPSPSGDFMQLNMGTDIKALALSKKAASEPGKVFSYYNINPQILSIVVERLTGKRYAQYLSERLWSKLGTRDAYVYLERDGGLARTYCCIQASAEDWVRVGLLHLNKGKVGDQQVVAADWMMAVTTPSEVNPNYGFQTWLGTTYEPMRSFGPDIPTAVPHSAPFAEPGIIYFDGAGGQRVYVIPSKQMVIVRTGKGGIDLKTGNFLWDDAIIPNALSAGVKAPMAAN